MNFQINIEQFYLEYIVAVMGGLILYLLYFILVKDTQYSKQIRFLASTIENINQELFSLKKQLTETKKQIDIQSKKMSDDEIYQEIERGVYDMLQPVTDNIKQLQESFNVIESKVDFRLSSLEHGVKQISLPSTLHAKDDEKIIQLFNQGVPLETIIKELHISKAEVEFVLKIHKIK
ncbi:MAG: hypothetical protein U9P38_02180 [Campylobacterota bacterium]|nr:hypothetical protein [Campylobacterota bacterium]